MSQTRPDLTGEMRVRFPLPIVIPLGALILIAGATIGFSRVLLSIPPDAAVAIALMMAINVLGACAFIAIRKNLSVAAIAELAVVVLYPVLIGIAIAQFGLGTADTEAHAETAAEAEGKSTGGPAAAGGALSITASGVQFDTETLDLAAGEPTTLAFSNEDTVQHNVAIYPDQSAADAQSDDLFKGEIIDGGSEIDYEIPALDAGEYVFQCDIHPGMTGTVTVA